MCTLDVSEIWIEEEGRLLARLADESLDLTHIYRTASGVNWDAQARALCSPVPRDWSHADWFVRIVKDVRSEYGIDLILVESTVWRDIPADTRTSIEAARARMSSYESEKVDERTTATYVGDDRLRREAKELFAQKEWKAVVATLEALQYPQFMDHADAKRLEIARRRSKTT